MSDIPARIREEIATRSGHRCELFSKSGGRCAGFGSGGVHHVVYRSRGGGHEIENLLLLCETHHSHIHKHNSQILHENGHNFYQFDVGPRDAHEWERWWFWPEHRDELQEQATRIHDKIVEHWGAANASRLSVCALAADVDALGLYELHGYDSATEYLISELAMSDTGANQCLNIGHFYRVNPHLLQKAITAQLHWSTVKGTLGSLKRLPGERVEPVFDEIIEAHQQGTPVEAIIASAIEASGRNPRWNSWEATATVALSEKRLTLTVHGKDTKARRIAYRKACGVLGDAITITDWKEREV